MGASVTNLHSVSTFSVIYYDTLVDTISKVLSDRTSNFHFIFFVRLLIPTLVIASRHFSEDA